MAVSGVRHQRQSPGRALPRRSGPWRRPPSAARPERGRRRARRSTPRTSTSGVAAPRGRGGKGLTGRVDGVGHVVEPWPHPVDEQFGVRARAAASGGSRRPFGAGTRRGDRTPGCRRRTAAGSARRAPSARRSVSSSSTPPSRRDARVGSRRRPSVGTRRRRRRLGCGTVLSPETMVIGNSRPLAAWMVMIRTASSSVSGRIASSTRAPSAVCWPTQWR